MKKSKRKARNKIDKAKINFLEPLPIKILGTSEDPCFGKLHNPKDSICRICGDSEICSIAMGRSLNSKRTQIEAKQPFKDTQKLEKPGYTDKEVLGFMKKKFKKGYSEKKVLKICIKKFSPDISQFDLKLKIKSLNNDITKS